MFDAICLILFLYFLGWLGWKIWRGIHTIFSNSHKTIPSEKEETTQTLWLTPEDFEAMGCSDGEYHKVKIERDNTTSIGFVEVDGELVGVYSFGRREKNGIRNKKES